MKQITCEMCGSTELVKEDGVFICQSCGCKYSVEEAKKMMVEIDNTKKLGNLYERARKSLEVDDLKHAAEYYKEILDEIPNDWEAYFYSYLNEFSTFTNAQAGTIATKLGNTIPPALDLAVEDCDGQEASERIRTMATAVSDRLVFIASTGASMLREYEGGGVITWEDKAKMDMYQNLRPTAVNTIASCVLAFEPIENKIEELLNSNENINRGIVTEGLLYLRCSRYDIANTTYKPTAGSTERLINPDFIHEYAEKVHELDPNFKVPSAESVTNKGGCYVATAVYGSYDCPQVWTLRRYRDYTLAETRRGQAFIKAYYAISPTLVRWFGDTKWFKTIWRGKLDKMVEDLQAKGIDSSPYEDRTW